jgi:hypothetical protein
MGSQWRVEFISGNQYIPDTVHPYDLLTVIQA